jgi:methylated-DNA-[protein]-cysteine S-methyltransferase
MRHYTTFTCELGTVTIQCGQRGVTGVWFENQTSLPNDLGRESPTHPILIKTKQQLEEYFSCQREGFDLPLEYCGTPFQQAVWQQLIQIPFGETRSYQEIAIAIGNPKAVRAVGAANGKNPISVIVPCHRVIGASGKLTGYAGGIDRKQKLLQIEKILID